MGKVEEGTGAKNRAQFILGSVALNRTSTGSAPFPVFCEIFHMMLRSFHLLHNPCRAACRVIAWLMPSLLSFPTHCLALLGLIGFQVIPWLLTDYVKSHVMNVNLPSLGRTACSSRSLLDLRSCMEHFHCVVPTGLFRSIAFGTRRDLIHMSTSLFKHLVNCMVGPALCDHLLPGSSGPW